MTWQTGVAFAWGIVYLLFAFSARQRDVERRITRTLIIFAILSALREFFWAAEPFGWLNLEKTVVSQHVVDLSILMLALVFWLASYFFLQVTSTRGIGFGIGAALGLLATVVIFNPFGFDLSVKEGLFSGTIYTGWLAALGDAGLKTLQTYYSYRRPQHRNRIFYWGFALIVIAIGDGFLFGGSIILGSTLHLIGTLLVGYVAIINEVFDLVRGLVRLVIFSILAMIFVGLSVVIMNADIQEIGGKLFLDPKAQVIAKALVLVIVTNPFMIFTFYRFDKLISGKGYNRVEIVREYSLRVSNLPDLLKLSSEAIKFIDETFGVEFGYLFLADINPQEKCYSLKPVLPEHQGNLHLIPPGKISTESNLVRHILEKRSPFTQYNLDFISRFRNIPGEERRWLSDLQADLFVPICTKEEWQGLFVLGLKRSGDRYSSEDIQLLAALADQTVGALQNARLFTDLEDAKQALVDANAQLREVDELKSAFLSVITHEMRTPVANMGIAMQLLERYGIQNLTSDQAKQLSQVSSGVKTTRALIDNLILNATFLSNQVVLSIEKIDFKELLRKIVGSFEDQADRRNLRFRVDDGEDPIQISADRKLLGLAIHHLVENAIKFNKLGGLIWIRTWTTSRALWFEVRDTGKGIAQEKLDTIWDSFSQPGSDALRRGVEGLGLGLSLVKFIITAHGGFVGVESEVGEGSVFSFQIPLQGPDFPLEEIDSETAESAMIEE